MKVRYRGIPADVNSLSDLKRLCPELLEEAKHAMIDEMLQQQLEERADLIEALEALGFPTDGPRLSREHIVFEQVLQARRGIDG